MTTRNANRGHILILCLKVKVIGANIIGGNIIGANIARSQPLSTEGGVRSLLPTFFVFMYKA